MRDAQRESIAGAGRHDGVLQSKQSPRFEIPPEAGVEIQLLPHLLNYNEIHVAVVWRLVLLHRIILCCVSGPRAHEVTSLLSLVRPGFPRLCGGGGGCGSGGRSGERSGGRSGGSGGLLGSCGGTICGAFGPSLFERRYLGVGSGSSWGFQRAVRIVCVISNTCAPTLRAARACKIGCIFSLPS